MFESTGVWDYVKLFLFNYYGIYLYIGAFAWVVYETWLEKQQEHYIKNTKWIFLEVHVDELNEKSSIAMEQVFAAMHALFQSFSLGERWTGKIPLWMSAELVSIGGRVSYIFKLPERYRNLLESSIFAQYPKAEIREVQDYLANLPRHFDPAQVEFEMWGTQLIKKADNALPIRTYRFIDQTFEHASQKSFLEPLSGVIEAMSNIMPHELSVMQIVIQPTNDDWKKTSGADVVNKMKGIPPKAKPPGIFDQIFIQLPGKLFDLLIEGLGLSGEASDKKEEKPQSQVPNMSDFEKGILGSVSAGLNKLSFKTKIRILYLAPKDKFSKGTRIPELLGAFRAFDNPQLNGLRPDVAKITTDANFKLFQALEQPWIDYKILERKNKFLRAIKDRSMTSGTGSTIMNVEELATIFHFPQVPNARVSQIERVHTVKSAPPIDLPVG